MAKKTYTLDEVVIQPHPIDSRFIDLTHQKFNMLYVLGYAGKRKGNGEWWVECDCGVIKTMRSSMFRGGETVSCGCYGKQRVIEAATKHGHSVGGSTSPEYQAYSGAKNRCTVTESKYYDRYGGRGIKFLFKSFDHFIETMGERPSPKHSLDRRDNNGPYSPENCRWATRKEQERNKRSNRLITAFGETKTAAEWAEEYGVQLQLITSRLDRYGWCVECAITFPPGRGNRCHNLGAKAA